MRCGKLSLYSREDTTALHLVTAVQSGAAVVLTKLLLHKQVKDFIDLKHISLKPPPSLSRFHLFMSLVKKGAF